MRHQSLAKILISQMTLDMENKKQEYNLANQIHQEIELVIPELNSKVSHLTSQI